jgi:UDP-glucose 4-epimerase
VKTLVFGSGGLIGSSLETTLRKEYGINQQSPKINWTEPHEAINTLSNVVQNFFLGPDEDWVIAWCAGLGTFLSIAAELEQENLYLATVLNAIKNYSSSNGVLFYTSSAGAIYNAATSSFINEDSPFSVMNDYGEHKLTQEQMVADFAVRAKVKAINGRLVSVYGPNQNLLKPQGLISKLCLSSLQNQPTDIYAPMGTSRNYLFVDDATKMILKYINFVLTNPNREREFLFNKIFCADQSYSIAAICRDVSTVAKRKVLLNAKVNNFGTNYPRHFSIKSEVLPDLSSHCQTTLLAGIASVYHDIQGRMQLGMLPTNFHSLANN